VVGTIGHIAWHRLHLLNPDFVLVEYYSLLPTFDPVNSILARKPFLALAFSLDSVRLLNLGPSGVSVFLAVVRASPVQLDAVAIFPNTTFAPGAGPK